MPSVVVADDIPAQTIEMSGNMGIAGAMLTQAVHDQCYAATTHLRREWPMVQVQIQAIAGADGGGQAVRHDG